MTHFALDLKALDLGLSDLNLKTTDLKALDLGLIEPDLKVLDPDLSGLNHDNKYNGTEPPL